MADETKTKIQLIAELEALRQRLDPPASDPGKPASEESPAEDAGPVVLTPSTRRGLLGWITPVILSLGAVAKLGTAQAASTDDFTTPPVPTRAGRCLPIAAAPTASPTPSR